MIKYQTYEQEPQILEMKYGNTELLGNTKYITR